MSHSADFIKAKTLYYKERYEPSEVKINLNRDPATNELLGKAHIVFEKDGKKEEIISSEDDFFVLASSLQTTVRNGIKKLVEIKNTNKYYENVEFLLPKSNNEIQIAIKEITEGKFQVSKDFILKKAIYDVLDGNFSGQNATTIIKNYNYVLANEILLLNSLNQFLELFKRNNPRSVQRFTDFMDTTWKLFQSTLFQQPPLEAARIYRQYSNLDLDGIATALRRQELSWRAKWNALSDGGKRPIDGQIAAKQMVDDYADMFEISKKILRGLARLNAHYSGNEINMESFEDIDKELKSSGYNKLVASVDRALRNAGSHWEVDYEEKGFVKIIDTRGKKPKLIKSISYNDLMDKTRTLRDLTFGLFFGLTFAESLLIFRALDSPDLKFTLIENYSN
ncbi:MAG: hypothetical protein HYY37_05465 [Candidatus Aenigmarchaeota archaeon]|nr:hypothetical protein [Candidatus Aenigmarchaeota archaeon]